METYEDHTKVIDHMDYDVLYYNDTINSPIAKGLKWKLILLFDRMTSNNTIAIFYDDGNGLKKDFRLHTEFPIIALEIRSHKLKKQSILDDKLAIYLPDGTPGSAVKLFSVSELMTAVGLSYEDNAQKENPYALSREQEIQLLFKTPYENVDEFWREFMENVEEKSKKEHDKVIVVQLDCLMPAQRADAFRKSLLDQMKDGLIIIPPYAHVTYVGDECTVEVKEMKEEQNG